jgi:hypothetical protein
MLMREAADEISRLRSALADAHAHAGWLLDALHPGLNKLHTVCGVIDQIDNVTVGLRQRAEAAEAQLSTVREELRFAKAEFQCIRHWLDRAQASDYRYRDDPALDGHRQAAINAAERISRSLSPAPLSERGRDGIDASTSKPQCHAQPAQRHD